MKRRSLVVEVAGWCGAIGGRSSFDGRRDKCLLTEAKHAEPVGDEVQAFEEEGLGWLKDRWNPHPNRWECRKLQRVETNHIVGAHHGGSGGKMGHSMTKRC